MLWRVEKDIFTTDTDRLHQLLMDETLPLFQRYRAMFSLRNKVNDSRIENNAFLHLQMLWRVEKDIVTTDTDRRHQLLMDETLPLFQRYRAMFSLRNKVNKSRIENNAFLRLQMLWRVEKDIVTSDTDRLHQLLMDETLPMFQRYRAMFSLRNKVNESRIENNAFLRLQMLCRVEKDIVTSDTDRLQQLFMDETLPLFQRYRAMFSLRNKVNDSRTQLKRTSSRNFI
jgi:hypothetical protein